MTTTTLNPIETNSSNTNLVSKNYGFLDTKIVLSELEKRGFQLEKTVITKPKKVEKLGYQRHRIIFNHPDFFIDSGNKFQLLVQNSHDGSESLRLNLGVYRLVCSNGLIKGETKFSIRIKHSKNAIQEFLQGIEFFMSQLIDEKNKIVAMQKRLLSEKEIESFKNKVFDLKFGQFIAEKKLEGKNVVVDTSSIDSIRRNEDKENTLYNVLNRIQENVIRGGIKYQVEKENNIRFFSTRKVKSINQDTHFNTELYNYAMELLAVA